jgi:NADH dehydrogenase (ubiquinone) 1 alpha subcomplex subunit 5
LSELNTLPSSAVYTQSTKAITEHRLNLLQSNEDVKAFEDQIGQGHIEEILWAAEKELKLIPQVREWKMWEELQVKAPENQWTPFKQ